MELTLTTYIILLVLCFPLAFFLSSFVVSMSKIIEESESFEPEKPLDSILHVVEIESYAEIIGYYGGAPIYKTITLKDGTIMEYVSIAVELGHERFATDKPALRHCRLGDKLLYREIPKQPG